MGLETIRFDCHYKMSINQSRLEGIKAGHAHLKNTITRKSEDAV